MKATNDFNETMAFVDPLEARDGDPNATRRAWRVVIVEDSPEDQVEIRRLLLNGSDRRYQLVDAGNGEAGIRAALDPSQGLPECVILDYSLPDMDAVDVLAALAGGDGLTVCPVVVLTGVAGTEIGREVIRAGAQDYIGKGRLTAEGLTRVVENAVERHGMARELSLRTRALEKSERRFRIAAAASHTMVCQFDPTTRQVTSWHGLEELLGFRDDEVELTFEWWMSRVEPSDVEGFREAFSRVQINPHDETVVYRIRHKDGRYLWVEGRCGFDQEVEGGGIRIVGTVVDISKRKYAEEALRRSHDMYSKLLQDNPYGISLIDADFRLQQVSMGARASLRNIGDFIGMDAREILRVMWPEPFAEAAIGRLHHTLASGEPFASSNLVERRKDIGELQAYDWRVERVTLVDGRYGLVCYFYDLSERRLWEEQLSASKRELQMLADNSPNVIARYSRELRYVFINEAIETATGMKPEEFLGRTHRELGMPADLSDIWDATLLEVFQTGESKTIEFDLEGPHGLRHYFSRCVPEWGSGDEVEFVLVVSNDVTDRKIAEQAALRAGDERLRIALAAARAGAWEWDIKTGAIVWSSENYSLYGRDPDLGPPSFERWMEKVHSNDLERVRSAVADSLQGQAHEYRVEFRIIHPTKGLRWLLGIGKVETDAAGQPLRMIGINLDITQQKQFEQALADQDRRKDEFLATLAHELRNPLAPIRNGLEELKYAPLVGPTAVVECREMMERQVAHMVRLVDDLLDVSRIGSGKIELKRERVEVSSILKNSVESSRPLLESARHELVIRTPEEPIWLEGDPVRLSQIVGNVLNNAAKYTSERGRIELSSAVEGEYAVIRVRDNGEGIPREMLSKVFDMFTQVEGTLNPTQGGLGIGLSLVKKLVEMHGGTIEAESEGLGYGSTFTIRLPRAHPQPQRPSQGAPGLESVEKPRSSALRVLVVDDNKDAARSLARLLKIWGHSVSVAHGGLEAIATASVQLPDLVILDIGMPDMDGFEICRRLQTNPAYSATTFVALTGWGTEEDKKRTDDAGFDFHLVKPIAPEQIESLLRQVANRRRRGANARD